jgi:transcriptional regulator with XRE-family HTH domain
MRYRNNIRALQNARALTIDQAAAAMGMSRGGYLKIQRGENRLTSTTIALAARAFGVAESEIISDLQSIPKRLGDPAPWQTRQGKTAMGHEPTVAADYFTVIAEDGTTTLPQELREGWGVKAGDKLEFFQDHTGAWQVRPRNAGPLDFLKSLAPRAKRPDALTDDEALTKAMSERNHPHAADKAEK